MAYIYDIFVSSYIPMDFPSKSGQYPQQNPKEPTEKEGK